MKFLSITFVSLFSFTATATTTAATSIYHHDVHVFENHQEEAELLVVNPFSRTKKTIGEPCSDDRECITRYCIGSNDLEKVCLKSWGSKCESDEECASQYCSEESTTCDFKIEGSSCTVSIRTKKRIENIPIFFFPPKIKSNPTVCSI